MPSMCRPVLIQGRKYTLPPRNENWLIVLYAFNAAQGEELVLQSAVMAGYFRENDGRIKSGKGALQVHSHCEDCMVLALEKFGLVGVRSLQASATAVAVSLHEAVEQLQWELPVERHSFEFGPEFDRGGLNSAGGRLTLENYSSDALLLPANVKARMVRPRQRLLSRRGSVRGGSSCNPVANSHHHCCCRYFHRRSGATPLQVSQYMDSGSPSAGPPPLPAFGTAVFTLGGSRNNARINAHISVLFIEDPKDEEGGSGSKEVPSEDTPETIEEAQEGVLEQTPSHPHENEASTSKQAEVDMWEGRPEGDGWC